MGQGNSTSGGRSSNGNNYSTYPGQRAQMQRNPNYAASTPVAPPPAGAVGSRNADRASTATSTISRPGSYAISRNSTGSNQVFR
eukprot:CAMPEP_0197256880 /NCGR_PEP_ID=MMETSP1429-20130617/76865_1 /TAXON_ID=49237 /ORGANISM="Chaetoceros  sp., Strain UNC1202" /LENGTH=83 /DNA_ID=CAMNT_0042720579 /DNA_START=34 /DNA_END=282 /DNA_ORIENTATION=+